MEVKEVLRQIMYEKELNQLQLAKKLEVSPSQISQWLEGKNLPRYEKLKAICTIFDIDANVLLGVSKKTRNSCKN